MIELVQANWPLVLAALLIGLAVAWLLLRSPTRTTVIRDSEIGDTGPAKRNQALIDAPPVAASLEPRPAEPIAPAPMGLAGGEIPAAAAQAAAIEAAAHDDLTLIKGVGPKLAATLRELGVNGFAQIAAWDEAEIDRIDAQLGRFEGRIRRDDWVAQAALLAAGDRAGYESRFGKLEG